MLCPDSTASRTFSRWQGPGRVLGVRSPHSYVVDLNETKHHVQANRLKRFLVLSDSVVTQPDLETICTSVKSCAIRTHRDDLLVCDGCAVINDCDSDFGDVHTFEQSESKAISPPSQKIDPHQISHLTPDEQRDLLCLLDRFSSCFSDDPGLCTLVRHEINLLP